MTIDPGRADEGLASPDSHLWRRENRPALLAATRPEIEPMRGSMRPPRLACHSRREIAITAAPIRHPPAGDDRQRHPRGTRLAEKRGIAGMAPPTRTASRIANWGEIEAAIWPVATEPPSRHKLDHLFAASDCRRRDDDADRHTVTVMMPPCGRRIGTTAFLASSRAWR